MFRRTAEMLNGVHTAWPERLTRVTVASTYNVCVGCVRTPCEENTTFLHMISQWFIRKTYPIVCYSQAIRGDQNSKSVMGLRSNCFKFFKIITFYVDRGFYRHANNLRKILQRGRKLKVKLQLLMFGSRNRRTKSRKNAITHIVSQIPGYATNGSWV